MTPIHHRDDTSIIDSMQSIVDIESDDGMATTTRAMASSSTGEYSPSRDEVPAATSPVGVGGVFNAGAVASNDQSPNTSLGTSNAERNTNVQMDEGAKADIVNDDSKPRVVTGTPRSPVLPTKFEGDLANLKARLLAKGANDQAVELCNTVFENGVTIEALEERMTREQCEGLGVRDGKKFRLFLTLVVGADGQMTGQHRCCLCSPGKVYKNHRDALRHLLKDHFGLSFRCKKW